ncbi:MAG: nucleotidyltransferase family protein [Bacteroidales bacterium]
MFPLREKIQQQREEIIQVAGRHRAVNVRLFGSVARGDENEASDIDMLVDFLPGASLLDQVALIHDLSDKLQRKVDVVSTRALNPHLREDILKEAVQL